MVEGELQNIKTYVRIHCPIGWSGFGKEGHQITRMYNDNEDEDSFNGDMQLGASDIRDNIMQYLSQPKQNIKQRLLFYCHFQKYSLLQGLNLVAFFNIHFFVNMYLLQYYCYCYLFNVKIENIFLAESFTQLTVFYFVLYIVSRKEQFSLKLINNFFICFANIPLLFEFVLINCGCSFPRFLEK